MQVAGRVMEFAFSHRLPPLAVGTLAFALLAVALVVLCLVQGIWIAALAFALLYGWANGLMTIVRGTVPSVLFGSRDYGALLGRLAQPQFILKAWRSPCWPREPRWRSSRTGSRSSAVERRRRCAVGKEIARRPTNRVRASP
jgi:hypothetical protein